MIFQGFFGLFSALTADAASNNPKLLNYQARITDDTGIPVADGTLNVAFAIYSTSSGASGCLWSASNTDATDSTIDCTGNTPDGLIPVTVKDGVFSVVLGDTSNGQNALPDDLFDGDTRYLGITVESDSEMTPRKRITSAPYAFNADRLDDLDTSSTGGTGAYVPVTDSSGNLTITGQGTFAAQSDSPTETLFRIQDASGGTQYLTTSSTSTYLAGNVGIGTQSPTALLTVNEPVYVMGGVTASSDDGAVFSLTNTITSFGRSAFIQGVWDPASNDTGGYGLQTIMQTEASNSNNVTGFLIGMEGRAEHNGSGTVPDVWGLYGAAAARSAGVTRGIGVNAGAVTLGGTIADAYGVKVQNSSFTGSIIDSYGIYADNVSISSGAITNAVGIAILNQTASTDNTNLLIGTSTIPSGDFSIYNSSTRDNYFAGAVGIATSTPATQLDIYHASADDSRMFLFGPEDSEFGSDAKSSYVDIANSVIGFHNNLEAGSGRYNGLTILAENDVVTDTVGFQALTAHAVSSHASGNKSILATGFLQSYHTGAGTVTDMYDLTLYPRSKAGSGTVTRATGIYVSPSLLGTTTDLYRIRIAEGSSAGTITNSYGLYLDEMVGNGDVLNYSIFNHGPNDDTGHFVVEALGNVGIGTAFPSSRLTVSNGVASPTSNIFEVTNAVAGGNYTNKYLTVSSTNTRISTGANTPLTVERTSRGEFFAFEDGTDDLGMFTSDGTPESSITADRGSIAVDTTNGDLYIKTTDGVSTGWELLDTTTANPDQLAIIADVKAAGTPGGSTSSGTTYTRDLNTEQYDPDGIVSISSNQFTLQAGTYHILAAVPAYRSSPTQAYLYNVTDSATSVVGTSTLSANSSGNAQTISTINGVITLASAKTFEILHYIDLGHATYGLGYPADNGQNEVYTQVTIRKMQNSGSSTPSSRIQDADNNTFIEVEDTTDVNEIRFNTESTGRAMTILDNGYVGVGSSTPIVDFVVGGKARFGESIDSFNDFGNAFQNVTYAERADTSGFNYGGYFELRESPASGSTADAVGLTGNAYLTSTTAAFSDLIGMSASAQRFSTATTGTVGTVRGLNVLAANSGGPTTEVFGISTITQTGTSGTITDAYGWEHQFFTFSGGTITDAYGMRILNPSSGGTITNNAAITVDGQTGGTNNTNLLLGTGTIPTGQFSIYNASTNDNYFAGDVGIGTSAPAAPLHVASSGTIAPALQIDTTGTAGRFTVSSTSTRIYYPASLTDNTPVLDLVGHNGNLSITFDDSLNALKGGVITTPDYNNADDPNVAALVTYTDETESILTLGGGSSIYNTFRNIDFYTASATNTLTGTKRMAIEPTGNVTFGDVTHTDDGQVSIRQDDAADIFNLYDGTTNVLTVVDGGSVGIGDSTPGNTLQVSETQTGTDELTVGAIMGIRNLSTTNNTNSILAFQAPDTASGVNTSAVRIGAKITNHTAGSSYAGDFFLQTRDVAGTGLVNRLYIHDDGNTIVGDTMTEDGQFVVRQDDAADIFNLYDGSTNVFSVLDGGNVEANASVTVGDASTTDTVTFNSWVSSNFTPSTDNTYDLGDWNRRWKDLYLSGNTIHIGGTVNEGTIRFNETTNQLELSSSGGLKLEDGLDVRGKVPTTQIGSVQIDSSTGIVNQVEVQGDHAYVHYNGTGEDYLAIVDISDPENPTVVSVGTLLVSAASLKVQGDYLYVQDDPGTGRKMRVYDISDPSRGTFELGSVDTTGANFGNFMDVKGQYAYSASSYLNVIDVSNPSEPFQADNLFLGSSGDDVKVRGEYAYILDGSAFRVIDVSNPTAVVSVATESTSSSPQSFDFVGSKYAYVVSNTNDNIGIIDISDPTNPAMVAQYDFPASSDPQQIIVQGERAYVANTTSDVISVLDVSNPLSPTEVGTISVIDSYKFDIKGRYLYAIHNSGTMDLRIYDLNGGYIQQLEAGGLEADEVAVTGRLDALSATVANGLTVGGSTLIDGVLSVQSSTSSNMTGSLIKSSAYPLSGTSFSGNLLELSMGAFAPSGFTGKGLFVSASGTSSTSSAIFVEDGAGGTLLDVEMDSQIGIGTSSPAAAFLLDVSQINGNGGIVITGDNTQDNRLKFEQGDANDAYVFQDQTDGNNLKVESAAAVAFNTGGANERMRINSDGDVVICNGACGTQDLATAAGDLYVEDNLEVESTTIIGGSLSVGNTSDSGPDNILAVEFGTTSTTVSGIDITNTSTGDANLDFHVNGATTPTYHTGVDNSNGDKFQFIYNSSSFDTAGGDSSALLTLDGPNDRVCIGLQACTNAQFQVIDTSALVIAVNRDGTDGALLEWRLQGITEGTVSGAGGTITYGTFTGSHNGWTDVAIDRGKVVRIDGIKWRKPGVSQDEPTYDISESVIENDPQVIGSFLAVTESEEAADPDTNPYMIMAVGNGDVWVVDNGTGNLAPGDGLITSGVKGYAAKDPGTYPVAHIFSRVAEYVDWDTITETHPTTGQKIAHISILFDATEKIAIGQIDENGTLKSGFNTDLVLTSLGEATSSDDFSSRALSFRASAWNSASSTAVTRDITMSNTLIDKDTYNLEFLDNDAETITKLGQDGSLYIAGKLFPSDRGTLQEDKYIFYDGSAGPGGDMMRTNAAGWSTGSYDFAEMFPTREEDTLEPGTIVVADTENDEGIIASTSSYQNAILGIISTKPGFLAGENKEGDAPVALIGRVPTKVNLEGGEINIGDPITSSSEEGVGMKATEPGRVVGIALQKYDGSNVDEDGNPTDMIVVYVNPSWWNGPRDISGDSGNALTVDTASVIDFKMSTLSNVDAILSSSGMWSIGADGHFFMKRVETDILQAKEIILTATDDHATTGEGVIKDGYNAVLISNPAAHPNSRVFVSFLGNPGSGYWIGERGEGDFTVHLATPAIGDLQFEYWILNVDDRRSPEPEPEVVEETPPVTESGSGTETVAKEPLPETEPVQETPPESPVDSGTSTPTTE